MVERIVTAIEAAVLGLWAGAMAGFAFVFAPVAFRAVTRMDTFATLIANAIRGVGSFGAVCGAVAIVAALIRSTAPKARPLAVARIALVAVAFAASRYETAAIIPRMEATAAQIAGPIDSVPKSDPRRIAYGEQHQASSRVYGAAFLCVLAALVLVPFGRRRPL
ncbi:MAG: DUF4149 domain-containing protein [Candidatus Eremiobacteraeota bacterium]|nr:DUF4149 domain-containing protein [Candidatus Eremiobacteraeota bacterium]